MAETAIFSNQREAERLYQRGVAAARSGQRRVAVGLLQRAVQLDQGHEGAWLWLSGVLDDPVEAEYCLRSVLTINPANERARAGLAWAEQRVKQAANTASAAAATAPLPTTNGSEVGHSSQVANTPVATSALSTRLPVVGAEPERTRVARQQSESWWVNWRSSRRDLNRARVVTWLVPILLLSLTLAWRQSVEQTVQQIQFNLRPTAAPLPTAAPVASAASTPEPLPPGRPRDADAAAVVAYLSQIEPLRVQLRTGVEEFRQAIKQPGMSSIQHAAAARQLRDKVQNAHTIMIDLEAPRPIAKLHDDYVEGLNIELQALDDMLEFYGAYNVAMANRAAIRFQESSARFTKVQIGFDEHLGQIERIAAGPPAYSPR